MKIKRFKDSFINESKSGDITLYRLVAVGDGEDLVVDTKNPGKFYFKNKKDIDTDVIKKQSNEYHVIKVVTDKSNIDDELSLVESDIHNCDCVVLVDDSKVEIKGIEPFE